MKFTGALTELSGRPITCWQADPDDNKQGSTSNGRSSAFYLRCHACNSRSRRESAVVVLILCRISPALTFSFKQNMSDGTYRTGISSTRSYCEVLVFVRADAPNEQTYFLVVSSASRYDKYIYVHFQDTPLQYFRRLCAAFLLSRVESHVQFHGHESTSSWYT